MENNVLTENRHGTAKRAIKFLEDKKVGFKEPDPEERQNLLIAFAKKNKAIHGKAFDIIKVKGKGINLKDPDELAKNLDKIIVYEVKSTNRESVEKRFKNYFFTLTTAELLVAQSLKKNFKFIFVNIKTGDTLELTLNEIFKKSRGIYPVWSIRF